MPVHPDPIEIDPDDHQNLARMAAKYCRLANPATVRECKREIFPAVRGRPRYEVVSEPDGQVVTDDNMIARWALLWSHGITSSAHPSKHAFAHVWTNPQDRGSYTHIGNIIMITERLASLTDNDGPLAPYLRYHAQKVYGWRPAGETEIQEPAGFREIKWQYFAHAGNPHELAQNRLMLSKSKAALNLMDVMGLDPQSK